MHELHVIKAGFWQSYHWPTAVITKSMHSCLWLTRLGNVITKVCLIWGAQGPPCETCVFARAIPVTLSSYPNRVLGHDSRCTGGGRYCEWKMIKRGRNRWDFAWSSYFCLVILWLFLGFFSLYVCLSKRNNWLGAMRPCKWQCWHCKSECFYLRSSICPQTKERARQKCPGVSV